MGGCHASGNAICRTNGCIIRISAPETNLIIVVCRASSFAHGETRQRQIVDGPALRRRLPALAAGYLPEDCFSDTLVFRPEHSKGSL
jgi:hypothetical protein